MSTTMEILAATERRLNNSVETCAELREKLAQAERERNAAVRDRDAAQREANKYAADLMEANGQLAQLDAAHQELLVSRAQVQRLREALAPFAACGAIWKEFDTPDSKVLYWARLGFGPKLPDVGISVGDLRKADDALRDTEPHGETEAQP